MFSLFGFRKSEFLDFSENFLSLLPLAFSFDAVKYSGWKLCYT